MKLQIKQNLLINLVIILVPLQGYANAADAFKETSDLLMSAEMRNNQSVALLRDKQAQAAFEAALGTDEVFADIGDNRRQGMALANQAAALAALKRPKEAIELLHQGCRFPKQGGGN